MTGGSATYVDRLIARLPDVRRSCEVTAVIRHDDGVDVRTADDHPETFDRVVVATHADQALGLLADASAVEKEDLGAITYSVNETWLHRDSSVLPARRPPGRRGTTGPTAPARSTTNSPAESR